MNLFDFGIALGFVGIIMLVTGRVLSKYPLVCKKSSFHERKYYSPHMMTGLIHLYQMCLNF